VLILARKNEWNRPFGRPLHRWEDNIGMNLKEIGWESVDWIHLAQDRDHGWALVNMVTNFVFCKRQEIS
jgi:hypothetical protein